MSPSTFGHNGFTGTSLWMDPVHQCYVVVLTNAVHPEAHRPEADLVLQVFIPFSSFSMQIVLLESSCCMRSRKETRPSPPQEKKAFFHFLLCVLSLFPPEMCRSDPKLQRRSCATSRSHPARWMPGASLGSARTRECELCLARTS